MQTALTTLVSCFAVRISAKCALISVIYKKKQSQKRVSSAYEKYMSAPPLFRSKEKGMQRGSTINVGQKQETISLKKPVISYHQQLANQKAKAKERDER